VHVLQFRYFLVLSHSFHQASTTSASNSSLFIIIKTVRFDVIALYRLDTHQTFFTVTYPSAAPINPPPSVHGSGKRHL